MSFHFSIIAFVGIFISLHLPAMFSSNNNKLTNICINEKNNNDFLIIPLCRQMFDDSFLAICVFYDLLTAQEEESIDSEAVIDS